MLQRRQGMLDGRRLKVRRPARLMGTNAFRMKIPGTTSVQPANHAVTESQPVYR